MDLRIHKFEELSGKEVYKIAVARFEVFVGEQKITEEPELDGIDDKCYHVWIEDNNIITAYCRIVPKGLAYDNVSIGRVLVNKEYRRKGLAQRMLKEALKYIKEELKEDIVVLSAQLYVKGLYEDVGFKVISDVYDEANIPHVKMKIEMK